MPCHQKGEKYHDHYKFKNIVNPIKRAALVGNYAQIFRSLAQLQDSLKSFNNLALYAEMIRVMKTLTTRQYSYNIKTRDFCEIVQGLCIL